MNGYKQAVVQEPQKAEADGVLNKNTGFSEPLSPYCNTTLSHPSADTSPSASIESADVPIARTQSRHSSFRLLRIGASRYKSKGSVPGPSLDILSDNIQSSDGSKEEKGVAELTGNSTEQKMTVGAAMDTEQLEGGENHRLDRVESQRDAQGYGDGHERKKGILRKLQLHKA